MGFSLTAVNILNELRAVRANFNSVITILKTLLELNCSSGLINGPDNLNIFLSQEANSNKFWVNSSAFLIMINF